MARLKKVVGERGLYKDPSSGTYFVRVYHNGSDTFQSLETTRIKEAIACLECDTVEVQCESKDQSAPHISFVMRTQRFRFDRPAENSCGLHYKASTAPST